MGRRPNPFWVGDAALARRAPDSSTLSRRVRGVLSPYRERENAALARLNGGEIPAYAGMTGAGMTAGGE